MNAPDPLYTRRCMFCGGGPPSDEHVIPVWLARVLDSMETGPDRDWRTTFEAGGLVEIDRDHPSDDGLPTVVVRDKVCVPCNTGWMSRLEVRVSALLEPMVRGERTALDMAAQIDIATWASKTFMTMEYYEPQTIVTRPEDRELMKAREQPPVHHRVRLLYRNELSENLVYKILVGQIGTQPPPGGLNSFAALFAIGFLIIQLWGGHGDTDWEGLTQTGSVAADAIMIWPPTPTVVSWPPLQSVTDDELDELARRPLAFAEDSTELADWRERNT